MLSFLCVKCVLYVSMCIHLARLAQDDSEFLKKKRREQLEYKQREFRFENNYILEQYACVGVFSLFLHKYSSVCILNIVSSVA